MGNYYLCIFPTIIFLIIFLQSQIRMKKYYRATWTSGRYDKKTHSAIIYNLLSGMAFFFEDGSADFINEILKVGRNGEISLSELSQKLGTTQETIISFLDELIEVGIISDICSTKESLRETRSRISSSRMQNKHRQLMPKGNQKLEDAEKDYQHRVKSDITSILFELTYNCSAKCIHCYNPGATRNDEEVSKRNLTEELNIHDYKKIIDDLYDHGLLRVCLSGGDPFSKSIIWEIIAYLYEKEIVFDIYTNGLRLLDSEEKLASFFPCSVGVSLYSNFPEIHDSITRIPGSFLKTIKVIDRLAKHAIPIEIKCCIMKTNVKSYRGVSKIADKYSAGLQYECNIFDSVDGDSCVSKYLRLSRNELRIVLRDRDVALYVGSDLNNYGARKLPKDDNVCGAGYSGFCLMPDGTLTLCVSFPSKLGDLRNESLTDVLSRDNLKWWKNLKLSDYEECGKYDYCDFCALCPGLNFTKTGSPLKASDNNCYVAKIRKDIADDLQLGNDPLQGKTIDEILNDLPDVVLPQIRKIESKSFYKTPIG